MDMKDDLFSQIFVGEEVEIITRMKHKVIQDNGESQYIEEGPITFKGYLLDMDKDFLYLAVDMHAGITRALKREEVLALEIVEQINPYDSILENMSTEGNGN